MAKERIEVEIPWCLGQYEKECFGCEFIDYCRGEKSWQQTSITEGAIKGIVEDPTPQFLEILKTRKSCLS